MSLKENVSTSGVSARNRKVLKRKVQHRDDSTAGGNNSQFLNHASHLKAAHMNQMRKRKRDFFNRINYSQTLSVVVLPLLALVYLFKYCPGLVPENKATLIFSCIYYNFTMLAFTSGYHKCFAHNAFRPQFMFLQVYFAVFGSSLGMGSIKWWVSLHRSHHQFTDDTERDPYLIKRGFTWAHWGWLIKKPKIVTFYEEFMEHEFPQEIQTKKDHLEAKRALVNEVDFDEEYCDDELEILKNNYELSVHELILWQNKYYFLFFILSTLVIPVAITVVICKDTWVNGLLYPGILRMFLCQQLILSTESVCHMKGLGVSIPMQPFNDKNSSQNCMNPLISFLTYGQALQNFHHEFPHDYRCAPSLFTFDPTKWYIWTLSKFGFVSDLCTTPKDLITQLRIQQKQEVINRMKSQLNWGTPISKLPLIKPKDFKKISSSASHNNRIYIVIQNIIHDITSFMDQHPGGVPLLKASHGKDATKAFYGGVYGHLTAAANLLATMRIGVLDVGNDEEVWKRVVREEGDVTNENERHENKLYRSAEAA